jgi:hypothetical protein
MIILSMQHVTQIATGHEPRTTRLRIEMKKNMPTTTTDSSILTTKHVAAKFGIRTTHLRRILRTTDKYDDGRFTRYAWKGWNDPDLKKAMVAIEAALKGPAKAEAEHRKAKAAKADKATKAPRNRKPAATTTTTDSTAPSSEGGATGTEVKNELAS